MPRNLALSAIERVGRRQFSRGRRFVAARIALDAVGLVLTWTSVAFILWWLAPRALVASSDAVAALAQAIPAVVVAIYVLALGSLFVVAQVTITAYGHRSVILFVEDPLVARVSLRPLLLTAAAVLLAGQVPAGDEPSELLAAGMAAVSLVVTSA
jgi:hypothetical protein